MVNTVRSPFHGGESRFVTSCTKWDAIPASGDANEVAQAIDDRRLGGCTEQLVHRQQRTVSVDDRPRTVSVEPVEHSSVTHHVGGRRRRQSTLRIVTQRVDRRDQLALVGRPGLALAEAADRRAAQIAQVRAATQQPSEIVGQRADVGAGRAPHLDPQHRRIVGARRRSNE